MVDSLEYGTHLLVFLYRKRVNLPFCSISSLHHFLSLGDHRPCSGKVISIWSTVRLCQRGNRLRWMRVQVLWNEDCHLAWSCTMLSASSLVIASQLQLACCFQCFDASWSSKFFSMKLSSTPLAESGSLTKEEMATDAASVSPLIFFASISLVSVMEHP